MSKRICVFHLLAALMLLGSSPLLRAQAIFIPILSPERSPAPVPDESIRRRPPPPLPPNAGLFRVTSSKVDVRVEENIATTSIEQSFLNQSGQNMEVRVMIPLPAGASINNLSLSMNDQMIEGQLHQAAEAQNIYQSIVTQRRDPALLRFAGENMYEARIFPVAPNEERRLKFSYTEQLPLSGGLYDYKHILSGSQLYQNGVEKFNFECTIRSKTRLGPVYSPTHQVLIIRNDEHSATVKLNGANLSSDRDFHVYYAPTTEDVAMRIVAHRESLDEDGYFMLIGRVDDQLEKAKILPKEIVFVLDISGSMQGEKIEQAKKALKFCLNSLNEKDRFNLITFSTDVQGVSGDKLMEANKENVNRALAAVDQIEATGGTNIDGAIRAALGSDFTEGSAKAKMVVFMTDGCPTVGVTDPQNILQNLGSLNLKNKVRFFNFGVGNDVNTHLLDKMALDQDGVSAYVAPKEDIEIKVSDFYSKIKHPVMTDVAFDFGPDVHANSLYPKRTPALYRGGEIMIMGRYKGSGPGELTLTGNVGEERRTIRVKVDWPARDLSNAYLPRVWAMRKVGNLLEGIRLNGQNQEMINEVVTLAQRFGIVTPYTSQLVLEPGMNNGNWPMPVSKRDGDRPAAAPATLGFALEKSAAAAKNTMEDAKKVSDQARKMPVGETANALSRSEALLKEAKPESIAEKDVFDDDKGGVAPQELREMRRQRGAGFRANGAFSGGKNEDDETLGRNIQRAQDELVKQAGVRTFYNRDGIWVDSTAKPGAKSVVVKLFSKEYFDLLKDDTTLGSALALGNRILVMVKDTLYQIEE